MTRDGFDIALCALLALTAVFGPRRHRLTSPTALATAVTLLRRSCSAAILRTKTAPMDQ